MDEEEIITEDEESLAQLQVAVDNFSRADHANRKSFLESLSKVFRASDWHLLRDLGVKNKGQYFDVIGQLPLELVLLVIFWADLDISEILKLQRVRKGWRNIFSQEIIADILIKRWYPGEAEDFPELTNQPQWTVAKHLAFREFAMMNGLYASQMSILSRTKYSDDVLVRGLCRSFVTFDIQYIDGTIKYYVINAIEQHAEPTELVTPNRKALLHLLPSPHCVTGIDADNVVYVWKLGGTLLKTFRMTRTGLIRVTSTNSYLVIRNMLSSVAMLFEEEILAEYFLLNLQTTSLSRFEREDDIVSGLDTNMLAKRNASSILSQSYLMLDEQRKQIILLDSPGSRLQRFDFQGNDVQASLSLKAHDPLDIKAYREAYLEQRFLLHGLGNDITSDVRGETSLTYFIPQERPADEPYTSNLLKAHFDIKSDTLVLTRRILKSKSQNIVGYHEESNQATDSCVAQQQAAPPDSSPPLYQEVEEDRLHTSNFLAWEGPIKKSAILQLYDKDCRSSRSNRHRVPSTFQAFLRHTYSALTSDMNETLILQLSTYHLHEKLVRAANDK